MLLIAKKDTFIKPTTQQASSLQTEQLIQLKEGSSFDYDGLLGVVSRHYMLNTKDGVKFAFIDHCKLPDQKTIKLNVPYFCQLNNMYVPHGTCNVTSIAMALSFLGYKGTRPDLQLEDEFYLYMERNKLSRHSPYDLQKLVLSLGYKDNFSERFSIEDMKEHLLQGFPIVLHGYFTDFGHIICLIGFNEKGFIVHDPYGEWFEEGYDINNSFNPSKGEALLYSYPLIQRTCLPDGGAWAHLIQ